MTSSQYCHVPAGGRDGLEDEVSGEGHDLGDRTWEEMDDLGDETSEEVDVDNETFDET